MELLDYMVVLFLVFLGGSSILFSTVTPPIYSPTSSVQQSSFFFHILSTFVICGLSDDSHSGYKVVSHQHFPDD